MHPDAHTVRVRAGDPGQPGGLPETLDGGVPDGAPGDAIVAGTVTVGLSAAMHCGGVLLLHCPLPFGVVTQ